MASVADPINAKAYDAVLAKGRSQPYDVRNRLNTDAPSMRPAFDKANAGIDSVTDEWASDITGYPMHVHRSNQSLNTTYNNRAMIYPMLDMIDKKVTNGRLNAQDIASYNQMIEMVSRTTHMSDDLVWSLTRQYEADRQASDAALINGFGGNPPSKLKRDIGQSLLTKALGGTLTPTQETELSANLAALQHREHLSNAQLAAMTADYSSNVVKTTMTLRRDDTTFINNVMQERVNGTGTSIPFGVWTPRGYIVVPGDNKDKTGTLLAWGFDPDDAPARMPPGGAALGNFLYGIHESEHEEQIVSPVARQSLSPQALAQAKEIDADYAVLKYLDKVDRPDLKAYWLQKREVGSIVNGMRLGQTEEHDTATFLRVYEQTGKQIDLDAFAAEKNKLLGRVGAKLDLSDRASLKTADIMGAMRDVLADDRAQTDPAKKMSAVERAEAVSFLRDAEAVGYTANAGYPRPKQPMPAAAPERPMAPISPPPPSPY